MPTKPVLERHVATNKKGYVAYRDENAKLKPVYYFLPQGVEAAPHVQLWPQPSRDWALDWKPLLVGANQLGAKIDGNQDLHSLAAGVVLEDGNYLFADHFAAVAREVGTETKYQVLWGRQEQNGKGWHFWNLYVHPTDDAFTSYSMDRNGRPPGFVVPIWMAAESSSPLGAPEPHNKARLNDPISDIPGDSLTGGP